ncbi:uncharacterized protein PHACADRAFT_204873 [Phanerochaete carnosa HHB-10118-sp]|uniref:Glycoside hydrolase family 43 protein n=1 Tax=Phanerochaete carnosa (strain HHB-10118-sp) TaxID=650164 RepID=K5WQE8_PHACS|nr:uncharacterized protein PHACADRAFT_204873 [Phanerochaete carnosa HHB-10118-sp]EKM61705.1 hypothetical protein PHACADRAFT_204873 [Phanerochaete carnosa HHB-10118-sp]
MRVASLAAAALCACLATAQQPSLGLSDGFISFDTPTFSVQLVKDSQTLYSLKPKNGSGFDFIPTDQMTLRQYNGNYHLGDITFRVRAVGSQAWIEGDTSVARHTVTPGIASGSTVASSNLAPTLPSSPLNITRRWVVENGTLQLLFDVANAANTSVEIGALGAPLDLFDPYIGQDAGYVQVTPLLGTLPPLVVTPVGKSPLEGWRFLPEATNTPTAYQSQTFEALYEWQFHTLAYAENEWANATPWNAPSSVTLAPGQTRTYGLQFNLAPSIREIEDTLQAVARPVVVGLPGYILPMDQSTKLFLSYASAVQNLSVTPAGALFWTPNTDARSDAWVGYTLTGHTWGRARLTVAYADGTVQTVHYYVTKAATTVIADLGSFLTTEQWFDEPSDPFRRSPSVISYDRSVNAVIKDDERAWIPGLSDEAGAGSWLAATMKQFVQPNAQEVAKLEQYINQTLWGSVQDSDGSVKMSVYFYQPSLVPNYSYPSTIDWGNWWSWDQEASFATNRAYDFVHVTAAYWALYRVARNYPSLVKVHTWQWYLNQAVLTVKRMTAGDVGYATDGLMDETVIRFLLADLQREGLTANASLVESRMQTRAKLWATERFPFGSEMAWDSTGQEGVYLWSTYFNDTTTAQNVIDSIIAYDPTVPHWGYNGNARRYWDNIYGGKLMRIERQIHHYGSGLNALPLMAQFELSPTDYYLLRVAYGGLSGPLSNIDQGGFASASFHSFEDTLAWDAYSGDYGPNFVGHALGIGVVLIEHPEFGWQALGGTLTASTPTVQVQVLDSVRRRVFIAPLSARLDLDAGAFESFVFDPTAQTLTVTITAAPEGASGAASAPQGRLVVTQTSTASGARLLKPSAGLVQDAGAWVVPFKDGAATVVLS